MPGRGLTWLLLGALVPCAPLQAAYEGSSFETVSRAVFSAPYARLPQIDVEASALGDEGDGSGNHLRRAARRTLTVEDDLYEFPGGKKLFQANGRCFSGTWQVTAGSPFSGLFAKGSRALIIMRASVSLAETRRGEKRAFALAGKLFANLDASAVVRTANFFAMENLLGTYDDYFLDATLNNEPDISGLPGGFGQMFLGLRISNDLEEVDRALSPAGPQVSFRPLDPVAHMGLAPGTRPVVPRWMRLTVRAGTPRVDAQDFRDELALAGYPRGQLRWNIDVAAAAPDKEAAAWQRIGYITLDRDIVSRACDARLHFAHPRVR